MPYKNPEDFREWKKRNPETREARAAQNRRSYLRNAGWTLETFTAASVSQAGLCAICGLTTDPRIPSWTWGLDARSQACGPARSPCSTLLPMQYSYRPAARNPEICRAAAEYLEAWSGV